MTPEQMERLRTANRTTTSDPRLSLTDVVVRRDDINAALDALESATARLAEVEAYATRVQAEYDAYHADTVVLTQALTERDARLAEQAEELRDLQAENESRKANQQLLTHKIITCGVAASHPDAHLTRTGAYKEKWDSPQAESVRKLRADYAAQAERIAVLQEELAAERVARLEMVRALDTALHGSTGAQPRTPEQVWRRLLDHAAAQQAEIARLVAVSKEFVEADVNYAIYQDRLKAANDRADRLYQQWTTEPTDELQARRRENLDDCLRLADVASQERRRLQAARKAIDTALTDIALNGYEMVPQPETLHDPQAIRAALEDTLPEGKAGQ